MSFAMINAKKKALSELIKKMRLMENKDQSDDAAKPDDPSVPDDDDLQLNALADKASPSTGSNAKGPSKASLAGMDNPNDDDEDPVDPEKQKRADFLKGVRPKAAGGSPRIIIAAKFSPKPSSGRKLGRPSRKI